MKIKNCSFLSIVCIFLFLVSCTKSCQNKPIVEDLPIKKEEFKSLTNFDYKTLTPEQKNAFNKLLNDEVCPCDCPSTFFECVENNSCPAGKLLAQWSVDQLLLGAPERNLFKALSEEINTGFKSNPKTIDVSTAYQKGDKKALITIVEFADFECPACKVISKEIRAFHEEHKNDVQIYFMHFPLSSHPNAEFAAIASEAAHKLGKFWPMHDLLFDYEGSLSQDSIKSLASKLFSPSEVKTFEKHLADKSLLTKVTSQKDYALNTLQIMATPSLFINGRLLKLPPFKETLKIRIEMEKLRDKATCK